VINKAMDNEILLQNSQEELNEILRPFQKRLKSEQRMADFIKKCISCAGRDDFLQLDELLSSKLAKNIIEEEKLKNCRSIFDNLEKYTSEQVERYRIQFIDDLSELAENADLPIEIDFPRFSFLKGIDGKIEFSKRITTINKKTLKSIDPRRIITAALRLKKQLYDRPFDPQKYIDSLFEIYTKISKTDNLALGNPVPIQQFYLEYVISLQSKIFFTNMDKGKFKGYSLEQFSVDLWRYFEADVKGTSNGMLLQLTPGRNNSLWLIDREGERQQITAISFHGGEE
jgi:hypothetical protein